MGQRPWKPTMIKIFKYIVLFLLSAVWVVSCVPILRKTVANTGMIPDDYRFGDLYRLSNLAQFKEKITNLRPPNNPTATVKNQAIYIIGDSFTESNWILQNDFGVDTLVHVPWYKTQAISLDTSQFNILIIESVERHCREHFAQSVQNIRFHNYKNPEKSLMADIEKALETFEETMESMWLSNDLLLWFKESKSKLNEVLFDRISDKVSVSNNKQHLLLRLDIDSTLNSSCFSKLPDSEIDSMISVVNLASRYYKKQGFDAVFVSVIPNKSSIVAVQDGIYNRLIERFETNPKLKVPIISVWRDFNRNPNGVYLKGDSHWNSTGRNIWVKRVNDLIAK